MKRVLVFLVALAGCGSSGPDTAVEHPTASGGAGASSSTGDGGDPISNEPKAGAFGTGPSLRADRTEKAPNLDGMLGSEWPKELSHLSTVLTGSSVDPKDISAQAAILYDDKNVYLGADVADDTLRGGADRLDLVIAAGGAAETISVFPGQPGKSAGKATKGGRPIQGAKVVEAATATGWTLEASIPWSAIGDGRTRVGLRGGLFVEDADATDAIETVIGTSPGMDADSLAALLTTPEQGLADGLVREKHLGGAGFSLVDDVAGSSEKERVLVLDSFLVVLGSAFKGGTNYYFADMSTEGTTLSVLSCELKDFDGDGKKEIVLKKRYTEKNGVARDVLDIESFGSSESPTPLLRHEIGISSSKGSIANDVAFSPDGGKVSIKITPGTVKGYTRETFSEPMETTFDPVLLPWDVDAQVYKLSGATYAVASTARHNSSGRNDPKPQPIATTTKQDVKPPDQPKPDADAVYALYKKDRGASGSPRFDLNGDVDGDTTSERVLLHDKDLVVFGAGFKSGRGFSYTTLPFDQSSDIESVVLKDVTGDKKADIVVRGIVRSTAPKEAGGGDVEREIEVVYRVTGEALKRVFAAEISRSIGSKKIVCSLSYSGAKATLSSGKAIGFTESDYPFNQDTGPVGGVEPLLLPWGGAKSVTYAWDGSAFAK